MHIADHEIQVWTVELSLTPEQENDQLALLSEDEKARAQRFHFPIHKTRFIATRSLLRRLLAGYLDQAAETIVFASNEHKKPHLAGDNPLHVQFNISHSSNVAVLAFTTQHPLGIDIEKIGDKDNLDLAQRFFSKQEHQALSDLPPTARRTAFYRLWAHKEAIIKASGRGLSLPLSSFTIALNCDSQTLMLNNETWRVICLDLHPDFQAALACHPSIQTISCWKCFDQRPILDRVYDV